MQYPQANSGKQVKNAGIYPYHDHQVKNTILKNRNGLAECYNTYIKSKPKITDGTLKVDFQLNSDGEVITAEKVRSNFRDTTLIDCTLAEIKTWTFPSPNIPAPVYVDHTFTFSNRSGKKK